MKAYNEYMNKISVPDTLHQKIVSCANSAAPKRDPVVLKRYVAVFACLAVVLLGIMIITQPGEEIVSPGTVDGYNIIFNQSANLPTSYDIDIPGHFRQELNTDEIKAVFPGLTETHSVTAIAHFKSDENGASLFNIDAYAVAVDGLRTYVRIAPGTAKPDYILGEESKTSDILGTTVTAGYFETKPNSESIRNVIYFASFRLSDLGYYVELSGAEAERNTLQEEFSTLLGALIKGGTADIGVLNPAIPELRKDRLKLDEARADADFGIYLPATLPDGFDFEDALRLINQEKDELIVHWAKGMGYIEWRVLRMDESDKIRITSVGDKKNYDLSLYPVPRADSVPKELREIVGNPIFLSDELNLEAVQARAYQASDSGDETGPRMHFSVLVGDIVMELNIKGVSAEEVFEILHQIMK